MRERTSLVRHHRQAEALSESRLELVERRAEYPAIEGDGLDAASDVVPPFAVE